MPEAVFCDLKQDFRMVLEPQYDTDLRADELGRFAGILASLSATTPRAYVATEYHGGTGGQAACTWIAGECVMPFTQSLHSGPISKALRHIGVIKLDDDFDEFDSLGLTWCRANETIAAFVRGEPSFRGWAEHFPPQSYHSFN
jgi:hypothetical protein